MDAEGPRQAIMAPTGCLLLPLPGQEMWDSVAYDFGDAMLRLLIVAQTLGHDDIRFTAKYPYIHGPQLPMGRMAVEVAAKGRVPPGYERLLEELAGYAVEGFG